MMVQQDWKKFKSGSDVRGVALEGYENQPVTLDAAAVQRIAGVFVQWLADGYGKAPGSLKIAIGRDCRLSSPELAVAAIRAMRCEDAQVYDCGLCTTPAMFNTTLPQELNCDAAIMITASHLPWNRNGMKFFTREGGLSGGEIDQILEMCADFTPGKHHGELQQVEFLARYSAKLTEQLRRSLGEKKPLTGLHIVVDAGNGLGGFFARNILVPLGADISGSQFLEGDGHFPNHIPNPEDETAMQAICRAVVENHADLGIIFDTDCDRAAVVDHQGGEMNRNRLIALVAAMLLKEEPGATIVTDSVTSTGLAEFIRDHGGVHRRFKRGYNNVIAEAQRLNAPVGIETSGHCALRENYYLDDGAYLVVRILEQVALLHRKGETISALTAGLKQPMEAAEIRLNILPEDFRAYGAGVLAALEEQARQTPGWEVAADSAEGVRVSCCGAGGWFLLRQSLHDPVLPLNIESDMPGGVKMIARALYEVLRPNEGLDISPMISYVG
ncbi:MAG: phosphomannomutase/phosphoglucomutase [Eubacteriales bacterium]|nr:phosphomannomutase/phosphoglucomutase [Eubacteriales bacterium]